MNGRPDWDIYFMLQSEIAKLRSNCITRQVGCVIVKDNRQIAAGYNGTPSGITNCFDGGCTRCLQRQKGLIKSGENLERCLCTHAEANAILQCAIFGIGVTPRNSTLYSTYSPCLECSKMAISIGIKRIVSLADYPEGVSAILKQTGIDLIRLNENDISTWISKLKNKLEIF